MARYSDETFDLDPQHHGLGRAGLRLDALDQQRVTYFCVAQRRVERCVEALYDLHGRLGWHRERHPQRGFEAGQPGFGDGRDIGQCGRALRAGDRQRPQLARSDQLLARRNRRELDLDTPGDDMSNRET